jgi:hypothetical protein
MRLEADFNQIAFWVPKEVMDRAIPAWRKGTGLETTFTFMDEEWMLVQWQIDRLFDETSTTGSCIVKVIAQRLIPMATNEKAPPAV